MKRIKFITSILLLSLISLQHSFAADFQVDGISYNITNNETNEVEVAPNSGSYSGSVTIPPMVNYNGAQYVVMAIGAEAFMSCNLIKSVTIPFSVTTIGKNAFNGCTGLTSITIPNSVTSIGAYAFSDCWYLTSVSIPNSVATIGGYAFQNCNRLKKVEISDLASWCKINFSDYQANPLNCAQYIYLNGVEIKDLEIPDGIISINDYAFYNCRGLTSVTIPNSVTTIGNSAFFWCTGLTSVSIPNSVATIGRYAFQGCYKLNKVEISDLASWCKINFSNYLANPLNCAHHLYLNGVAIQDLEIPDGITSINNYAFSDCWRLTSITIPNSVTTIGNMAFYYCFGLKSVTIPNSVTTIGDYAFEDCSSLTSVTIPNSVTTIGNSAFEDCSSLNSLSIGNKITSIGESAFGGCKVLNTVNIYATKAPTMSSNTFPYNTATFHVPRGCKAIYVFLYTFGNIIDDLENEEDGVDDIFGDNPDIRFDIYTLNGQVVKLNTNKTEVENLKPGLYIINGRKVIIK